MSDQAHPVLVDRQDRLWFGDFKYGLFLYDGKATKRISDDPKLDGRYVVELGLTADGDVRVTTMKQTRKGMEKKIFICDGATCNEVPDGDK